jgi:hypothetical protein
MRPYLQNNQTEGTGGMAQVVEHLLCECETLSSNSSPTSKERKENPFLFEWYVVWVCSWHPWGVEEWHGVPCSLLLLPCLSPGSISPPQEGHCPSDKKPNTLPKK